MSWPASSFASAYVIEAVRKDAKWDVITRGLRADSPFVEKGFAVMATTGKVSSEVISSTISKYLDGLIRILYSFGGDVVKFLGDAVLVSFIPLHERYVEATSSRREVTRRAIRCCATIMAELPSVEVDLTSFVNIGEIPELNLHGPMHAHARSGSKTASGLNGSTASEQTTPGYRARNGGSFASACDASMLSLKLHIGITCGMVDRCIIGSPDMRMEYVIDGDCLGAMSRILDGTAKGFVSLENISHATDQLGVSDLAWMLSGYDLEQVPVTSSDGFVILKGDGFLSIVSTAAPGFNRSPLLVAGPLLVPNEEEHSRLLKFLPTALAHRIMETRRESRASVVGEASEYRFITACFVKRKWKFSVKGKNQPIGIWSVVAGNEATTSSCKPAKAADQFGYVEERNTISTAALDWLKGDSQLLVVVEGPSGVGKTSLMNSAISVIEPHGVLVSLCQGSTVDQGCPYFAIRGLLQRIVEKMADPASSLQVPGLQRIDTLLLDSLYDLLGGNGSPLLISTIISGQRKTILNNCELRDGVLYLTNGAIIQNLKLDLASRIQTQYDSLDVQFKTFLRYAASLGQYFDVNLIRSVFDLDIGSENFDVWIGSHDSFAFLADAGGPEREHGYYFRHISILTCIYKGISFADRKDIHLRIANYLEQQALKGGTSNGVAGDEFVLPLVAYHFSRTGDFEKIIKYHDALGLVYFKKYMAHESIQTMQLLLAAVKTRKAEIANRARAPDAPGVMPSDFTVARWKRLLAESYRINGEFPKVVPLLVEVLGALGVRWPDTPRECRSEYRKQLRRQLWLWHRTAGATKDIQPTAPAEPEKEALRSASLVLLMQVLTTEDDSLFSPVLKYQRTLTTLLLINSAIVKCASQPAALVASCGFLGFMLLQHSPRLSRVYIDRYNKLLVKLPPQIAPFVLHYGYMIGIIEYVYGNADAALAHMRAAATSGDVFMQFIYVIASTTLPTEFMRSRGGGVFYDLKGILGDLGGFAELEKSNNYYFMAMNASLIARHLLFAGEDAEAAVWTARMLRDVGRVGNRYHRRAVFKMPIVVQDLFSTGNYAEACNTYLSLALELQHPLPPFLEFGTMLPQLTFLGLMLLFPAPFASRHEHCKSVNFKDPVLHALSLLAAANKRFFGEMHCVQSLWAQHVARAILNRFSNRKRGRGSLYKLKRMLKGTEGKKVKDWVVLRGYVCAAIAFCDPNNTERQRYAEAARHEFSCTFVRLQTWMNAHVHD
ncbi:hypothetical protein HK101_010049 [Irineochytrium annulatum]|nr:hypothetical protein HK101_010049 [Irineochytrium annulatum]